MPSHEAWQTDKVQEAICFVSLAPWQPANPLITWAAVLRGAWVVEPGILTGTVAAALKYQQAIAVKGLFRPMGCKRFVVGSLEFNSSQVWGVSTLPRQRITLYNGARHRVLSEARF